MTCKKVSKPKVSKIPCLRYRITDARLFKQGYLPGHVWTTRFQTMELNDIDNWNSTEVKTIQITYDYSPQPLTLQVRKFKPHEGDMLHRSWKHGSVKKSVLLPPYAIASFEAAEKIYQDYINQNGSEFFASTIDRNNRLLWETMSAAIKASNHAMVSFYFYMSILNDSPNTSTDRTRKASAQNGPSTLGRWSVHLPVRENLWFRYPGAAFRLDRRDQSLVARQNPDPPSYGCSNRSYRYFAHINPPASYDTRETPENYPGK
jgi:hypothetical protein